MSLTELFCDVDDFCQTFLPVWEQKQLQSGHRKRLRSTQLSTSEMMTIMILFHQSNYRTFKAFYIHYVQVFLHTEFPNLVSYPRPRFVALMPRVLVLCVPTSTACSVSAVAFHLWTQRLWHSATIAASSGIRSLLG